jgi:LmbE family N-acetylglucosaminyl deacetylase
MRARLLVTLVVAGAALVRPAIDAQVRPVYDLGAAGLTQVLERLQTTASLLHVGAHPDDEDSALLARAARGDNARVAYLSLNRGEGGQNIIGTELFEALGVIRTEELLQARALDGGRQFFTRTIDYGFSKTREEAAAKWNEQDVLDDMVRVIRTFRPLVISSRFTGTASDGHGQHQLAGYLTPLAFRAAADPAQFPDHLKEGLRPWQARKLYVSAFTPPAAEVETGVFDPVIGRSYAEIAAEGRSQHKSQEMGTIERRGYARSLVMLAESRVNARPESGNLFDGIDTSTAGIASLAALPAGALASELDAIGAAAATALADYQPLQPGRLVPVLASGLRAARGARERLAALSVPAAVRSEADFLLGIKEDDFAEALVRAAGIVVDPLAEAETAVPGSSLGVNVRTFIGEKALVRVAGVELQMPAGWTAGLATAAAAPGGPAAEVAAHAQAFEVSVPREAEPTQPYYLARPRDGDRYRWPDGSPKTLPFAPGPILARVALEIGGTPLTVTREAEYRFADRVRGEIRRNVHVVPALTLGVDSPLLIVPTGAAASRHRIVVTATSLSAEAVSAAIRLRLPDGWTSSPPRATVTLSRGNGTTIPFVVTAPGRREAGRVEITAEAVAGGGTYASDVQTVAYPHIQTHRIYRPAAVAAQVLDVTPTGVAALLLFVEQHS